MLVKGRLLGDKPQHSVTSDQPDVVERILRHCGLWDRPASRAPPAPQEPEQLPLELEYVDTDQFLMAL